MKAETASVKLSSRFSTSHVPQIKPTKMIIFQTLNPLSLCNEACREEEKNFCAFLPLVKILQGVISSLNEKFCIRWLYELQESPKPQVQAWGDAPVHSPVHAQHSHAHSNLHMSCACGRRPKNVERNYFNSLIRLWWNLKQFGSQMQL